MHHPDGDDMEPYERLLGDAMIGEPMLFAREDAVGPREADRLTAEVGGWHAPGPRS